MNLKDAIELQALLAADSNYTNPIIWSHGDGYQVETTRSDGAKINAKVSSDNLIVLTLRHEGLFMILNYRALSGHEEE